MKPVVKFLGPQKVTRTMGLPAYTGTFMFYCNQCKEFHLVSEHAHNNSETNIETYTGSIFFTKSGKSWYSTLDRKDIKCHFALSNGQIRFYEDDPDPMGGSVAGLWEPLTPVEQWPALLAAKKPKAKV